MDLNLVTTQPAQPIPSGEELLDAMRDFAVLLDRPRTPPRALVSPREHERMTAAGVRPELLAMTPLMPDGHAVVLDVDRIERECEHRLRGPL